MGFLDEFSEPPEQEKDRRASREGKREAREGSAVDNFSNDLTDEFSYGRDYLDRKIAAREAEKEAMRGDSSLDDLANDTHDELAHGPEYVARKQHYRERSRSSSAAEEGSNYGGGGDGGSGFASGGGGGGGGGLDVGELWIVILILMIPLGLLLIWKEKQNAIADIGTLRMKISVRSKDIDESGAIRYAHGYPQTVGIYVDWEGSLYKSQKPLRVTVSRDGVIQYDHLWTHDVFSAVNDSFAFEITNKFAIGRYLVRTSVEGAPSAEYTFSVQPRPPGNIFVSDTPPGWPAQSIKTLQHRPGENKKIYLHVNVNGVIPEKGRIVYIMLAHEGTTLLNYSNHVKEQNRYFYIPYDADFSEGLYTARLSADGDPPTEYTFKVQYPVVASAEEKNRRVAAFMDSVLPGSRSHTQAPDTTIQSSSTTTTQPEAPVTRPLQLGTVTTCEDARAWGSYQQKTTFRPGDRLCVYAEALNVNQNGQINLLFTFTVSDPGGRPIMSRRYPVALRESHLSWASWQYFNLAQNAQPGTYTVRVDVSNNLTREFAVKLTTFSSQ